MHYIRLATDNQGNFSSQYDAMPMDLEADTMVDDDELFSQVNENEWSRLIKRAK